jgi:hypothetical protein
MPKTSIVSIDRIRAAAAASGSHWFEPGAMRFFKTRLPQSGIIDRSGKMWFVSSEAFRPNQRKYSVRFFDPGTGSVNTHGDFNCYASRSAAANAMRRAITALDYPNQD